MKDALKNHVAVITGASKGLGLAIAKAYVEEGAHICICARNEAAIKAAAEELSSYKIVPEQQIIYKALDVSNPTQVKELEEYVLSVFKQVHILVNNAGLYNAIGPIDNVDWEEWKKDIEVNLYGSILCCRAFLPHFRKNNYGKIIQLAGGGATQPMPRSEAYAASKAGIVRAMESIAHDPLNVKISINSVSPGLLATDMVSGILEKTDIDPVQFQKMTDSLEKGKAIPLTTPAKLCVFLGSKASEGITGKLISAVWDNYETWPNNIEKLQKSDVYTLRRITEKERGDF